MTFPLPDACLQDDIAILGRKGRGKTTAAKVIVERILHAGNQVVVLDPLSGWWGLRVMSDGGPGFDIPIFGGPHADVPLKPAMGHPLADVLVQTGRSAVLDLGGWSRADQMRFARDLLERMFELKNERRGSITVVLEEADLFAPQQPQDGYQQQCGSEVDRLARRGRALGFKLITITQRPARLHKDVLTQLGTLIALGITGKTDRDAVKAWIADNAKEGEAKAVLESLATLKRGEAWLWSPEHAPLQRMQFPMPATLDTTATPTGQLIGGRKKLVHLDLSEIRALLAKVDERPADDGKVVQSSRGAEKWDKAAIGAAEQRGYARGYADGYPGGFEAAIVVAARTISLLRPVETTDLPTYSEHLLSMPGVTSSQQVAVERAPKSPSVRKPATGAGTAGSNLLAVAVRHHPARLSWAQLAALAGRKARGGHFNTERKRLIDGGLIAEEGDAAVPTEAGFAAAGGKPDRPASLTEAYKAALPDPAARMLTILVDRPHLAEEDLGQALRLAPRGGHWNTGLAMLVRCGLIEKRNGWVSLKKEALNG